MRLNSKARHPGSYNVCFIFSSRGHTEFSAGGCEEELKKSCCCPDGIVVEHYVVEGGTHGNGSRAAIDGQAMDYELAYANTDREIDQYHLAELLRKSAAMADSESSISPQALRWCWLRQIETSRANK